MYKLFTIVFLFLSVTTFGQQGSGTWKPFKLIIIQADTAILDASLNNGRDSMVAAQQKLYYQSVSSLEEQLNCTDCPKDSSHIGELRKQLSYLKSMEDEVKQFRCFHLLSSYSKAVYQFYFNEYKPVSTVVELPARQTDLASLAQLADTSRSDYVVFFSNIRSAIKNGKPILKLTTSLYSKKDNKIIFSKETEGDTSSRGEMWTCRDEVTCMFTNGVKSSTDEVMAVLTKRHMRKK
jgi:hypothetical protein